MIAKTRLLIASTNAGKLGEYAEIFADLPLQLVNLAAIGLDGMDVEEPYDTFDENAAHKARVYALESGLLTLADDSGLVVDALDGRPGVYSARYAPTAPERIAKLLTELNGVPDARRTARFVCVIAVVDPAAGTTRLAEGRVEGRIAHAPGTGKNGFGYDPVFIPDGYDVPLSDVSMAVKSSIDHRGNAARAIRPYLLEQITG